MSSDGKVTAPVLQPSDDPGWAGYGETILEIHGAVRGEVDLTRTVDAAALALFNGAGLVGTFGILTPENPFGRPAPPDHNAARRARLHAELQERGIASVRIDGLSRDRQHREIGVAIRRPLGECLAIARRWEQSAIYWFDGHAVWIVGALTSTTPIRLPLR